MLIRERPGGAPRVAAVGAAVAALAMALSLAACGGGGGTKKADAARVRIAETRWRAGLLTWRRDMLHALDGISVLFSTRESLASLLASPSKTLARLERYELTLAGCDRALRRLGPVPERFRNSGAYARHACRDLQLGGQLVEVAMTRLRRTPTLDPLQQASEPLGLGQSELATAVISLESSST